MGKYDALDDIDAEENPAAANEAEADVPEPDAPLPAALLARPSTKYAALDDIEVPVEAARPAPPAVSAHVAAQPLTPAMQSLLAQWRDAPLSQAEKDARARYGEGVSPSPARTQPQDQPRAPGSTGPKVGAGEAFLRGVGKASSFGFMPVLEAAGETAASAIGLPGSLPPSSYAENRERILQRNALAEAQNPVASGLGAGTGIAATIAPSVFLGGAPAAAGGALSTAAPSTAGAIGRAALSGGVAGAAQGAVQGAGEAISAGEDLPGVARGVVHGGEVGAITGAVTGGALTAGGAVVGSARRALAKFVGEAPERAQQWLVNTFVGDRRSFSLPAAKKALARDEEGLTALTREHPEILKAAREAERNHRGDLGNLAGVTSQVLDETTAPRAELYDRMSAALPGGGVTEGELVSHLEDRVRALYATRKGTDRDIADDVMKTIERIKTPQAPGMQGAAGGFDPNRIISPIEIRGLTTDAQDTAYQRLGGIFGTERFTRAKAAAEPLEDFLSIVKDRAARTDPSAVAAIDAMDKKISSLMRIKTIAGQRLEKAIENATGTPAAPRHVHGLLHGIGEHVGTKTALTGAALLAATGHNELAVAVGLPAAIQGSRQIRRALDDRLADMNPVQREWLTRVLAGKQSGQVGAPDIQGAIRAGVPRALVSAIAGGAEDQRIAADRALARSLIANRQVSQ